MPRLQRYEFNQLRMGVDTPIIVYAEREEQAVRACRAAYTRISELEQMMSDYRIDSELNLLCQHAVGRWVRVSPELFYVLWRAQKLAQQTKGAFDVTVGALVRLWREARRTGKLPDEATLREAKARSGYHRMELNQHRRAVRLKAEGMQLDLGGIAKGYACDSALRVLRRHGVTRALIQMGGDIVAGDAPPGERGWRIDIIPIKVSSSANRRRDADATLSASVASASRRRLALLETSVDISPHSQPLSYGVGEGSRHSASLTAWERGLGGEGFFLLRNAALSTSGSTEQYVEIEGRQYAHLIDPRTGLGLTKLVLARVLAPNGITSDSLATAAAVMGLPEAKGLERLYKGVQVEVWER